MEYWDQDLNATEDVTLDVVGTFHGFNVCKILAMYNFQANDLTKITNIIFMIMLIAK
jgi:hypothetical protein